VYQVLSVKGVKVGIVTARAVGPFWVLETGLGRASASKSAVVDPASEGMTQTDVDRETYENSEVFLRLFFEVPSTSCKGRVILHPTPLLFS
jgi:hypothetical protein